MEKNEERLCDYLDLEGNRLGPMAERDARSIGYFGRTVMLGIVGLGLAVAYQEHGSFSGIYEAFMNSAESIPAHALRAMAGG